MDAAHQRREGDLLAGRRCVLAALDARVIDEDDLTTGALWLAPGAPRAWFAPGKKFGVSALPTAMGPLSLEVSSQEDEVLVRVTLAQPTLCEVFYYDRAGQHRSQRRGLSGQTELRLPR